MLGEDDEALSVLITAVLFLWDCWLLSTNGRIAVFFSHDEWGTCAASAKFQRGCCDRSRCWNWCDGPSAYRGTQRPWTSDAYDWIWAYCHRATEEFYLDISEGG